MTKRIICFTGPKGSGKDEAAKRLFTRNQHVLDAFRTGKDFEPPKYGHINFAHPLKMALQITHGFTSQELNEAPYKEQQLERWPYLIPRDVMVEYAKWVLKTYGQDHWAKLWAKTVSTIELDTVVCTDLRRPHELEQIRLLSDLIPDITIVYVMRPDIERQMAEGQATGDPRWTDDSESHYAMLHDVADHRIINAGSLNDLYTQVDNLFPKDA